MLNRIKTNGSVVLVVLGVMLCANVRSVRLHAQAAAPDLAIARYTDTGALDAAFGTGGRLLVPTGQSGFRVAGIVTDSLDRIVVAGTADGNSGDVIVLLRLNADGSFDQTFGAAGVVPTDLPFMADETVHALAIDRFGRILVTGHVCCVDGRSLVFLSRYLPDGSRDTGFGVAGNGFAFADYAGFSSQNEGRALAIDNFDRIVVAGLALNGGNEMAGVARFTRAGRLDPTFDGDGRLTNDLLIGGVADAVTVDALSRITISGAHFVPSRGLTHDVFGAVRFFNGGALDLSFGNQGLGLIDIPETDRDMPSAAVLESDGRLVAVGGSLRVELAGGDLSVQSFFSLAAFGGTGTADPGFGAGGSRLTPFFSVGGAAAKDAALDAAGLIVAGGVATDPATSIEYFALARYANGTLDPSFGNGGQVLTSFGLAKQHAISIAIDTQGRIVAAGHAGS
jgi:uncharacterized delta-60 repeat protein